MLRVQFTVPILEIKKCPAQFKIGNDVIMISEHIFFLQAIFLTIKWPLACYLFCSVDSVGAFRCRRSPCIALNARPTIWHGHSGVEIYTLRIRMLVLTSCANRVPTPSRTAVRRHCSPGGTLISRAVDVVPSDSTDNLNTSVRKFSACATRRPTPLNRCASGS